MPERAPMRIVGVLAVLAGLAAGIWVVRSGGSSWLRGAETRRPNVLILMWDTTRADRMSLYGHTRETTPRLDAYAERGVVFEQAISPGMWTVPAHASLFTGLPVATHGANPKWIWLDQHFVTAAEWFGEAGYDTWAWSSNPYLSPATNLLQGFETLELSWTGTWADAAAAATHDKLIARDRSVELSPAWVPGEHGEGWPEHLTANKDGGAIAHQAFTTWLDGRESDAPFFAFVNYLEVHHPRVPSLSSREAVLEPEILESGLQTDFSLFNIMSAMEDKHAYTDAELEAARGVYDASIRDLDAVTGDLLDDLAARGVLEDTVVVVVADHGENLGEHGLFDHRWSVHQTLIHVPLVVYYPKALRPERVAEVVSTQNLFASLCAWTGVAAPEGLGPGLSARGLAFSELARPMPRLPVIRDAYKGKGLDWPRWKARYQVAIRGDEKAVRALGGDHAYYDLGVDPGELDNRFAADSAEAQDMAKVLAEWLGSIETYNRMERSPDDQPKPALLGDDTRAMLEQLGYTDGTPE